MTQLNSNDLRYFTGCALTGLLANTQFTSTNGQKYLAMKGLSLEALAVQSALETMEILIKMEDELTKAADIANAKPKLEEVK